MRSLIARVSAAGEPFQLFFTSRQMEAELRRAGFHRIEQVDHEGLNELYFEGRADGLKLSPVGIGMLATAWVKQGVTLSIVTAASTQEIPLETDD